MNAADIYDYLKDKGLLDEVQLNTHEKSVITGAKKHLLENAYFTHDTISYKDTIVLDKIGKFYSTRLFHEGDVYTDKPANLLDYLISDKLFDIIVKDLGITEKQVEQNAKERLARRKIAASRSTYINKVKSSRKKYSKKSNKKGV